MLTLIIGFILGAILGRPMFRGIMTLMGFLGYRSLKRKLEKSEPQPRRPFAERR